ncbi:VOC family protein [Luteimicrobium xylanilyticum]|uniref:2-polyprenyl-6-hydroxyphenol methylase n=1 Tax=Luteimicrobium xylanilyticum TaxID=1133546 RepID=A0A5P9Q5I8_9MICO|nr:VOC family protein [Luteimicrobium xylanilyticum]QFU96633.1 2-polyprenyl-6-hydroxyphenol methylase [Luteimicrobium xylanilyticum]
MGSTYLGLWYESRAEEAAELYVSIFPNSRIVSTVRHDEAVPDQEPGVKATPGSVFYVDFELDGLHVQALNGGPMFPHTEAASIVVDCDDQAQVDEYWEKLTADGGEPGPCGWLKDKFGLSWQIVPKRFAEIMSDPDREAAGRALKAMMTMGKLDVAALEAAFRGEDAPV